MPNTPDTEAELVKLERIAHRMEQALRIPGTEFRFGLDAILGLVPGIGDALTLAPSLYILLQARKLGASTPLLGRMGANLAIEDAFVLAKGEKAAAEPTVMARMAAENF